MEDETKKRNANTLTIESDGRAKYLADPKNDSLLVINLFESYGFSKSCRIPECWLYSVVVNSQLFVLGTYTHPFAVAAGTPVHKGHFLSISLTPRANMLLKMESPCSCVVNTSCFYVFGMLDKQNLKVGSQKYLLHRDHWDLAPTLPVKSLYAELLPIQCQYVFCFLIDHEVPDQTRRQFFVLDSADEEQGWRTVAVNLPLGGQMVHQARLDQIYVWETYDKKVSSLLVFAGNEWRLGDADEKKYQKARDFPWPRGRVHNATAREEYQLRVMYEPKIIAIC